MGSYLRIDPVPDARVVHDAVAMVMAMVGIRRGQQLEVLGRGMMVGLVTVRRGVMLGLVMMRHPVRERVARLGDGRDGHEKCGQEPPGDTRGAHGRESNEGIPGKPSC